MQAPARRGQGAQHGRAVARRDEEDLREVPTPDWGVHLADANIALDDLTGLVRRQAAAWGRAR